MELTIKHIKEKIEKLVQLYRSSISLNKTLELKIKDLESENTTLKEQIKELNTSKNALKLTTFANTLSDDERVELKKTIIEYIKEIDSCIKSLDQ